MSRVRKYRIFSGGAMHYGGFSIHATNGKVLPDFSFIKEGDPVTEFTGLTDKNGINIYEGDIVEHDNGRVRPAVYWDDCACFDAGSNPHVTDQEYGVVGREMKVIGNIYQNPELLT